jgi:hypothetical protein
MEYEHLPGIVWVACFYLEQFPKVFAYVRPQPSLMLWVEQEQVH